eukprot:scaffold3526_cov115-Cylindrotheca_fusiformis.AAC.9
MDLSCSDAADTTKTDVDVAMKEARVLIVFILSSKTSATVSSFNHFKEKQSANQINMTAPQESKKENNIKDDTLGMLIVGGMVAAAAGFTLYTKRTGQMLQQMEQMGKNKARRMPPPKIGPQTKEEWDKVRPRFDKDELI